MKHVEADVAVIGGGAAGMVAAVTAAERGARVVLFEKARHTGGAANLAMGPFGVESRLQRRNHIPLTRDEAFKLFMDYTHWSVDARLVRTYIDKSGSTIDWLETLGIEFQEPEAYHGIGYVAWHRIIGGAAKMIKVMNQKAAELGVAVHIQTPAKNLIKKDGRITGVVAEDSSGETIQANVKAAVIGTGGFGDNPEWIKKYTGYEWGRNFTSRRIPGLAGDGIRMAWEAGSAESRMDMVWGLDLPHPFIGPFGAPGGSKYNFQLFYQPNLMVNLSGERFLDEGIVGNWPFVGNAIPLQKNQCAFMIFDHTAYERIPPPWTLDADIKKAQDEGYKHLFAVDSLEELCMQTGIDCNGLKRTVDEYNTACETGRDEIFNKKPQLLHKIKKPKFYAARFLVSGSFGSLGGIKINYKTEVLTGDYAVIPGLYAAGTDANAIYGGTYPLFFAGNLVGFAINSGRIAAENAVDYIKSV
jgi:fumarate reductase flavoprotein subunit